MTHLLASALVSLAAQAPAEAAPGPPVGPELAAEIDALIEARMRAQHIPGLALGVLVGGEVKLLEGYGMSDVEHAVPVDPRTTVFAVYSVTKQFVAAAVLRLEQDGRIGLDDPLGELLFEPGTEWRYSNSNYFLLGLALEQLRGESLDEILADTLFEPLGMEHSRLDDRHDVVPGRARGYQWIGDEVDGMPAFMSGFHGPTNVLQNASYVSPTRVWAAGAALATLTDLLRWELALERGELLGAAARDAMSQPLELPDGSRTPYGLGTELMSFAGHRMTGHQGGGLGFDASILRLPDDGVTVVVLCNLTAAPSTQLALQVASKFVEGLSDDDW